jgi:hypothetical protein
MPPLYVVGDVHGHLSALRRLLQHAALVDGRNRWTGGDSILVVLGDMVDRGEDGIGVLNLLMDLQREAVHSAGQVNVLLGNHEVQLLAARRFGDTLRHDSQNSFRGDWHRFGGLLGDLDRVEPAHEAWLERLPTMLRVGDDLLVHADATFYPKYGRTIEEVNTAVAAVLRCDDPGQWDLLLQHMVGKRAFQGDAGAEFLTCILDRFGGRRLIHAHSPIARVTDVPPQDVTSAYVYHNGRCVNVDHGLYFGGPGFIFRARQPEPILSTNTARRRTA